MTGHDWLLVAAFLCVAAAVGIGWGPISGLIAAAVFLAGSWYLLGDA